MKYSTSTIALLASVTSVFGHATFQQLWIDGVDVGGSCLRVPPSNSPVEDVTSIDLRCNASGLSGVDGVCEIPAGSEVTVEMHEQPNDRSCDREAIGGAHHGPVIIYLSKVEDASVADGSTPWFKVHQEGFDPATNTWGTQTLNKECGKRTFTLPSSLAPGNYLLRAEVIALHSASSTPGAQFYMSCFQINVTGSGSATPEGVSIPGAYSASDPGVRINIYYPVVTNYIIPGPTAVYTE